MSNPPNILIVDDEEIVRETLGEYLKEFGCQVHPTSDGAAALEAVRERAFDLALIDIRMPGIDGLALLAQLRRLRPQMPVVMMTGHGDPTVSGDAERLGAASLLLKPVRLQNLDSLVQELGLLPPACDPPPGSDG